MTRGILFLAAVSLALPSVTRAQTTMPDHAQLDRIEHKLDEVLRRLNQLSSRPSEVVQGQPASGTTQPPSPALPAPYKSGAVAIAHAAAKDVNGLSEIPPDAVGGFVYGGGLMPFTDIRSRGVRYAGPVGVELQGWLQAKQAGRYEIGTDLTAHFGIGAMFGPTCFLQAWLEGRSLDQRSVILSRSPSVEASASLVLGAELQPGLYRLRVWSVCTASQGVTTASELLLKAPSELNLRPITSSDLLHRDS